MTPEQLQRLAVLEQQMNLLKAASTIPYEVDQAFRNRLKGLINLSVSGKAASSENKTVQESGVATYGVLNQPDGFLQITVGGTVYYLPYFT